MACLKMIFLLIYYINRGGCTPVRLNAKQGV